ncbi:restriction endonuclease subunit R [Dolichospermum sp. ST_sed1]|nr:restriction endonuclease subunit R [Dolichospermum sp. ST_sed1]MDD1423894.1 restriction endonuclease subunit R [Dolichospermum sp. ST_sed9]MDD1431577.1 restriction endonuclease subunit R [Dolichospermum sp. ST_sed6]MDD1440846.1 restriction endonuclease subunit R [Dolichospermum sp. ST_sed3]MDD1447022.1 restriction endonuclease subunit R [Dolichospermum sp. ST_sed8]MDD1454180.1 restriction endonuclease subunit R [Dolichospermum sp. ST_sed7]MDD1458768.1 restriction endonuclease subunit R [Do
MSQTLQASKLSLYDVIQQFHLQEVKDAHFFREIVDDLVELSDREKQDLDLIKEEYLYLAQRPMLEDLVKMVVLSPLLSCAGFYHAPFFVKAEEAIAIALEDKDQVIKGQIDLLVVQDALWIVVIEAKHSAFNVMVALPQILTYMSVSSQENQPVFGLITNGSDFHFIKLVRSQYAISRRFSLYDADNALYDVLRILKHLGQLTIPSSRING